MSSGKQASRRAVTVKAVSAPWHPGTETPKHLEAASSLPGNFGFDPLGLAKEPEKLAWYVQAELQNARWAMLGVVGILVPELLGGLTPATTGYNWVAVQTQYTYWADWKTLLAIELFAFAFDPFFANNKLPAGDVGYPGFDPLGLAKGDFAKLKQNEIKNGRLAMVAFFGILVQYDVSGGKGPLQNLADHLANPWAVNFLTNGKSLPFTGGADLNILGGSL
eukprot:scaffold6.g2676.t1